MAKGVPVAAVGYSRGGRLVMDYASVSSTTGLVPGRIVSVFPSGIMDALLNLAPLSGHTKVLILAGDRDTTVGTVGASQLVTQLAASGFPYADVRFETVRSHGAFIADHLSVLSDTPAAQQAFWARADRFLAPLALSYADPTARGRGGTGRRAGLRTRWASVLGGSTPLARIDDEGAVRRQAEWYESFASAELFDEARRAAVRLLGPGPGRCLDLGCGTGRAIPLLADGGLAVTGVDRLAATSSPSPSETPATFAEQLICADAHELPFDDASFDAVVSILTHTDFDDPRAASSRKRAACSGPAARSSTRRPSVLRAPGGRAASGRACAPASGVPARRLADASRGTSRRPGSGRASGSTTCRSPRS